SAEATRPDWTFPAWELWRCVRPWEPIVLGDRRSLQTVDLRLRTRLDATNCRYQQQSLSSIKPCWKKGFEALSKMMLALLTAHWRSLAPDKAPVSRQEPGRLVLRPLCSGCPVSNELL